MNVPSPCIQICRLNDDDICAGCGRTRDEIARWTDMSDTEKLQAISALPGRARIETSVKSVPANE